MALVINSKSALYGGVNQQAAVHRQETQVEEMVNAYPTLNNGLTKRNPTSLLELSSTVEYTEDMWTYEYDRGLSGESEEKYSIQISNNGIQIINVISGKVYTEANGLIALEDTAEDYLSHFVDSNGYSAITIKDTTFIANKNIEPSLDKYVFGDTDSSTKTMDVHKSSLRFWKAPVNDWKLTLAVSTLDYINGYRESIIHKNQLAPTRLYNNKLSDNRPILQRNGVAPQEYWLGGSTTSLVIDGSLIVVTNPKTMVAKTASREGMGSKSSRYHYNVLEATHNHFSTYNEYLSNIVLQLKTKLDSSKYSVKSVNQGIYKSIQIERLDGIQPSVNISVSMNSISGMDLVENSAIDDYYLDNTYSQETKTVTVPSTEYEKSGFFWIKGSNPTAAYSYTYLVTSSSHSISGVVSETTTEAVATAIKDDINSKTGFNAIVSGNIVKVTTSDSTIISNIFITDTYGNQASYAWGMEVQYLSDLPKTMPYSSLVHVIDVENSGNSKGYWLKYSGGMWRESIGLNSQPKLDATTMPHILVRNSNDTFTIKEYDGWKDMLVGDSDSNTAPSFVKDNNVIKDMFFFKNRLGLITGKTVCLSEVGEYGNFFRTSVVALLDSDRIDAAVDTTKSIELEFATYIQDSIMLFSDKAQFKLDGGRVLSPDSVQISQTSSYEMNKNVRPIFMNNIIFFCVKRGLNTAVMQYFVTNDNISEAIDITAHVEKYIPSDIVSMTASPINNMLFLTSDSKKDLVYVYKYYDDGSSRLQSAWFKWKYDADIYRVFSMGRNLNLMTNRTVDSKYINWTFGTGVFNESLVWNDDGIWINNEDDITYRDNFEIQAIHPISHQGYFVDASEYVIDESNVDFIYGDSSAIGELKYNFNYRLTLETTFSLVDDDIVDYKIIATIVNNKNIVREVESLSSELIISRSPFEEVVSITIVVNDTGNIEFNGFSCTNASSDNEMLSNSLFSFGLKDWTYDGWEIKYKDKDIGYNVVADISVGEWVYGDNQKKKQISGNLKMKSCIIDAEESSNFGLIVEDLARSKKRTITSKYVVGKKPIIYGDSKNIRLHIFDESNSGFRINSLSLEGNYNARDRRK